MGDPTNSPPGGAGAAATPHGAPTFRIALCMAGAISGGAYTAGVLDFLFEALHEWEKAKAEDAAAKAARITSPHVNGVSDHKVVVSAISGASAGSICAALLPVALAKREAPREVDILGRKERIFLPTLYDAWVAKPAFVSDIAGGALLGDADLNSKELGSVLDTTVLESTACNALVPPGAFAMPSCPNLSKELHLYITLGNLRGVPFGIDFDSSGDNVKHGMRLHADRAHVVFKGAGESDVCAGPYAAKDTVDLRLNAGALPANASDVDIEGFAADSRDDNWGKFLAITLGSAAFPAALKTRRIAPGADSYEGRSWPLDIDALYLPGKPAKILPTWASEFDPDLNVLLGAGSVDGRYEYRSVDGGTFNNEPFEIARFCLFDDLTKRSNPRDPALADRAVLLIDPFPEPPAVDPRAWKPETGLLDSLMGLPSAFKNQSRFKPDDLARALDESVFSRFLIAPVRRAGDTGPGERAALACGLLGGFGGFLDRKLREHDFVLGRRNCRAFLESHFHLDTGNGIFGGNGVPTGTTRPIIPLHGLAEKNIQLPARPVVHIDVLRRFAERASERADKVIDKLTRDLGGFKGWALRQIAWIFGAKGTVRSAAYQYVQADLIRRDQIDIGSETRLADLKTAKVEERLILAAFCGRDESAWRSASEIAEAAGFPDPAGAIKRVEDVADKFPGFVEATRYGATRKFRAKLYWETPKSGGAA